jgi:hypothetical protein
MLPVRRGNNRVDSQQPVALQFDNFASAEWGEDLHIKGGTDRWPSAKLAAASVDFTSQEWGS